MNTQPSPNYFPLSPLQHRMIMESLKSPQGAGSYIEQIVFSIHQDIDINKFSSAWLRIIRHHEIMRLGFKWEKIDPPLQYVSTPDEINIEFNDWSSKSKPETDEFIAMFLQADRRLGFRLDKPPVFRIALLKTGTSQYTCVWSFHHAIADTKTMVFILKDLFSTYHDPNTELIPPGSFKNHVLWLNTQPHNSKTKAFWEERLKGFTGPLCLPFYLAEQPIEKNRRQHVSLPLTTKNYSSKISSGTTSALNGFCQKNSMPIKFLLLGAWTVLLSHYSGKNEIVLGITGSTRQWPKKGLNDTGMYANTLPIRISIDPRENLSIFLNKIRNNWIKTQEFVHHSLFDIHLWSQANQEISLFDVLFLYNEGSIEDALENYKDKLSCSHMILLERTPTSLFLNITGIDELLVDIKYDRRKFDSIAIQKTMGHFVTFLGSITHSCDPKLLEISILTTQEKKEIATRSNSSITHRTPDSCIHHLIDIQVAANRDKTAVLDPHGTLSYGKLSLLANQLAHHLMSQGAMPETKIVVLLDQDINLIVVILGILKSGSAYVPIDPGYPDERINYIIKDCAPGIIITSKNNIHRITQTDRVILQLDQEMGEIRKNHTTAPKIKITPQNLAYILYTSSATGKPNGVMVAHGALAAFTRSASEIYEIRPDDRVLQFSSISGDAFAEEIFPTLFSGATLVIPPKDCVHKFSGLFNFCRETQITVMDLPTFYWHMIVDKMDALTIPEHLRLIIVGGEEADSDKVEKWNNRFNAGITLINTYGSTETTIAAIWANLSSKTGSVKGKISIGYPFPSVSLCIINQFQQPALPGTMGELCITGPQISKGYLNRKNLTASSFIKLKNISTNEIFFKTGDRVKMLPESGIHFYGRIDRQIKIRGFRVEPGEIEKTAIGHPFVSECAVAVGKDSNNYRMLVGFFVLAQGNNQTGSTDDIRSWLLSKLPEYMIPSLFYIVESLPHNASGKIDYKMLVVPESAQENDQEKNSPKTPKPPIILIGNSVGAARAYKQTDLKGHPFYHAPIFIHFYGAQRDKALSIGIPDLARKCIEDMLQHHPTGPYIIIGECLNSIVAHEVAYQLKNMGRQVKLLVIIDENWDIEEIENVMGHQTKGLLSFIKKQMNELYEFGFLHILKKGILRIKKKTREYYFALDGIKEKVYGAIGKPLPETIQFRSMENIFYKACESNPYTPKPYSGDVLLFYSTNWVENFEPRLNTFYKTDTKKINVNTIHSEWFKPKQIQIILKEIDESFQ